MAAGCRARGDDAGMEASERETLEQEIRRHRDAGDLQAAAAAALRGYGPELYGFLIAFHRREQDAAEVFSHFTERLWRGLPAFEWQCSFRTWAYTLVRNASITYRRRARRLAAIQVPLPEGSALSAIAQEVRSDTASFLRTGRRARIVALRDSLPPEDQELLVLRIDKRLAWNDLARVLHDEEAPPLDEAALKREAARLRKRFQLVKERLHELGRREGLVVAEEGPGTGGQGEDRRRS
jgi:RNA polymerase sigma-70 factor, ECF subfamily